MVRETRLLHASRAWDSILEIYAKAQTAGRTNQDIARRCAEIGAGQAGIICQPPLRAAAERLAELVAAEGVEPTLIVRSSLRRLVVRGAPCGMTASWPDSSPTGSTSVCSAPRLRSPRRQAA